MQNGSDEGMYSESDMERAVFWWERCRIDRCERSSAEVSFMAKEDVVSFFSLF